MVKWLCTVCNIYVYNEEVGDSQTGISPTTKVSDFPDSWRCPVCGATKDKLISIPEEEYWQKARAYVDYTLEKRFISKHEDPITETKFLGTKIDMPVLGAPMSGLSYVSNIKEEDFVLVGRPLAREEIPLKLISLHLKPVAPFRLDLTV